LHHSDESRRNAEATPWPVLCCRFLFEKAIVLILEIKSLGFALFLELISVFGFILQMNSFFMTSGLV
jgi:hypothetical protein